MEQTPVSRRSQTRSAIVRALNGIIAHTESASDERKPGRRGKPLEKHVTWDLKQDEERNVVLGTLGVHA
jgi:hypothetical protein